MTSYESAIALLFSCPVKNSTLVPAAHASSNDSHWNQIGVIPGAKGSPPCSNNASVYSKPPQNGTTKTQALRQFFRRFSGYTPSARCGCKQPRCNSPYTRAPTPRSPMRKLHPASSCASCTRAPAPRYPYASCTPPVHRRPCTSPSAMALHHAFMLRHISRVSGVFTSTGGRQARISRRPCAQRSK